MPAKSEILRQQAAWAAHSKLDLDARGYLPSYQSNLLQQLSPRAYAAFTNGSGSELVAADSRPAKMAALHSSSALAVNAFDYWSDKSLTYIASALGVDADPASFAFEAQFPTGLPGTPPNLDLAFTYADGRVFGIESKFTEWLSPKPARKEHFKPKYFPEGKSFWTDVGLPNAQRLAAALNSREQAFRYLDAAQLLKHMLGLATAAPGKASLLYVYYDCSGLESSAHQNEIEQFARLVGKDMPFRWNTYQAMFARLRAELGSEHNSYVEYLTGRYAASAG